MTLSYREVAEIVKIIDASQCEEVILELEGARLVVRRGSATGGSSATPLPPGTSNSTAELTGVNPAAETRAVPATAATRDDSSRAAQPPAGGTPVYAPMVGTFYRCPSPDEPPFVEIGSRVSEGDALCLIEVMKLYTTIEAPVTGIVEAVLADDASLVEFDQPLFVIRPE